MSFKSNFYLPNYASLKAAPSTEGYPVTSVSTGTGSPFTDGDDERSLPVAPDKQPALKVFAAIFMLRTQWYLFYIHM